MAIPVSELQSINPSAVIELFELQLIASIHGSSTLYRYHSGSNQNGNGELVWHKTFSNSTANEGNALMENSDNDLIFVG